MENDDDFQPNDNEVSQNDNQGNLSDKVQNIKDNIDSAKKFRENVRNQKAKQAVGKQAGKQAAKQATKTAASTAGGAATGGLLTAAMAAKDAKDKIDKKINKKIAEQTGIDEKKIKRAKPLLMIFLVIFLVFIIFNAATIYLANDQLSTDFASIIQKREERYDKNLIEFNDYDTNDLIYKNYDMDATDKDKSDPGYDQWIKDSYNDEYENYFNKDPNNAAEKNIQSEKAKEYSMAGRNNFNKIVWNIVDSEGKYSEPSMAIGYVNGVKTELMIPSEDSYGISLITYEDMVKPYLQSWIVPYALAVASGSTNFGDKVMNDMYSPITVNLYQVKRRVKITTTVHESGTKSVYDQETGEKHSESFDNTIGPNVSDNTSVYQYIPEIASAQGFYDIYNSKYTVQKIDPKSSPDEKSQVQNTEKFSSDNTSGTRTTTTLTEIWYEKVNGSGEQEKYKVSYYTDKDYDTMDRKISRVEWYQDYGSGKNSIYPAKTEADKASSKKQFSGDNFFSYDLLYFGYYEIQKYYDDINTAADNSNIDIYMLPDGAFYWPVGTNKGFVVTSPFGSRTSPTKGTAGEFHKGVDISKSGAYGSPVYAAQSGTVIEANDGSQVGVGYGNHIIIKHNGDYYTLYGHLSQIEVSVGQKVTTGQEIGKIGSTGNSTGPHLHFEIRKGTGNYYLLTPIDPMKFFNKDGTSKISGGGSSNLSAKVIYYIPKITEVAAKYGMSNYVNLIAAVMMQESGGNGSDVMQAAEGGCNTRYPHVPNGIKDIDYSIDCGIRELKGVLQAANYDIPLALQSYNFGSGFISYAKSHGGYSSQVAQAFSDMEKQKLGVRVYGDPLYVQHVMRYYKK